MSGLNLFLTPGTAPANAQLPGNPQALLAFMAAYMGISGASGFNGINFGSATPSPDNQNLPWFKTDAFGNPLGLFSWNGTAWVGIASQTSAGPSTARPGSPTIGLQFYDTTIGALIFWNGVIWTTVDGVVGDIKEVMFPTLAQALTNNPGWIQEPTTIGMVIGAAGGANAPAAAHPYGQIVGEEAHTLLTAEMPSHGHPESYAPYTGAFQNGPQPAGVLPGVTPGGSGLNVSNTGNTGGAGAHNNLQPTCYLWRLVKQQ
jgi:hypothetical protein